MPDPTNTPAGLKAKLARPILLTLIFVPVCLFIPAHTLNYWQGWAYTIVSVAYPLGVGIYFYKRDPQALARRLLRQEKIFTQKFIIFLVKVFWVYTLIFAGWDFRFGWTRTHFGAVPWWISVAALAVILASDIWFIIVLQANSFAASVIQIEAGQNIAATGPYRMVRHPMYLGMMVRWVVTPLALGSLVTLPVFCSIIPLFSWRLLNEEKFLKRELPGYLEYCWQTPWRLIPFIW